MNLPLIRPIRKLIWRYLLPKRRQHMDDHSMTESTKRNAGMEWDWTNESATIWVISGRSRSAKRPGGIYGSPRLRRSQLQVLVRHVVVSVNHHESSTSPELEEGSHDNPRHSVVGTASSIALVTERTFGHWDAGCQGDRPQYITTNVKSDNSW